MDRIVTLEDIAREMQVSIVTVSNALAGRSGVSEELRTRITEKAREMGYRKKPRREKKTPSVSKRYQTANRIGVVVPEGLVDTSASFYWELYQRLALEASRKGCFVSLEILSRERERSRDLPFLIREQQTDGLILLGMLEREYVEKLAAEVHCPVQMLDFDYDGVPCDAILSNGFYGSYQMTNYLIRLGHRKIGFVGEKLATGSIMDRYQGFSKSLLEHGIREQSEWILSDRDSRDGEIIFDLPEQLPTAFVCSSDLSAEKMAELLLEKGYEIPGDISLTGFDDFLVSGVMQGKLTTYAVDMDVMAHQSLKLMMKRLSGEVMEKNVRIADGKPVIRSSAIPVK